MIQLWNEGAYLVNGTELVADINEVKAKATDEIVDMLHLNDKFVNRKTS